MFPALYKLILQERKHTSKKYLQLSMIRVTTEMYAKYKSSSYEGMIISNLGKKSLRRAMPGAGF